MERAAERNISYLIWAAFGALAFGWLFASPQPAAFSAAWLIPAFALFASLAAGRTVQLLSGAGDSWAQRVTRVPLDVFVGMLGLTISGPRVLGACAIAAVITASLTPKRSDIVVSARRFGVAGLAVVVAALVYRAFPKAEADALSVSLVVHAGASMLAFWIVLLAGEIVAQRKAEEALAQQHAAYEPLCRTVGAILASTAAVISLVVFGNDMSMVLVFELPVGFAFLQVYRMTKAREHEREKRIQDLDRSRADLGRLYNATIQSLALAVDAKDQYTHQHILRVQTYAVALAKSLGIGGDELEAIRTGALLHDIGKLGVPEYVLLKPGRLTDEEFAKIRLHPEIGAAILEPVEFPWPVVPIVKHHHERWDGKGYPDKLAGEDIPLNARIMAVADVYDALTSSRSYRKAWSHEMAIAKIIEGAGTQFDPRLVDAFAAVIEPTIDEMATQGHGPRANQIERRKRSRAPGSRVASVIGKTSAELWALYEIAQTLSTSMSLQDTLHILGRKICEAIPGSTCLFQFRTSVPDELGVRAAIGPNCEYFVGGKSLNSESLSLRVMMVNTSYSGEYDHDDLLLNAVTSDPWIPKNSALVVPVTYCGEPIGVINLYHPSSEAFGDEDTQLLESVAEKAAMAFYNGLLKERTAADLDIDPLTGIRNVWHVTELLDQILATGKRSSALSVICFDLDSFSAINDAFGVPKGDEILRDFAEMLQKSVGNGGSVARYGGDGFVVLLEGAELSDAAKTVDRVRNMMHELDPKLWHDRLGRLRLDFSAGVAVYPEDGLDGQTLLRSVERNLQTEQSTKRLGALVAPEAGHRLDEEGEEPFAMAA